MRWFGSLYVLAAFFGVACKSTDNALKSVGPVECSDAGHLERVLSVLVPAEVRPDRRICILNAFQDGLGDRDRYNLAETLQASSQLQGYTYTKDNIFDRKAYIRGPAIFKAQRRMIAEAQEEVLLETRMWESVSASSQEIMRGLEELQSNRRKLCNQCRPVTIRILAGYGPTATTNADKAIDYGADARQAISSLGLDPRILNVQVLTYTHTTVGTNHAKALVIDGQIAMVMGANVQRFYDPDINWYDVGYMMAGEVARGLRIEVINNLIRAGLGTEKDGDEKLATGLGTSFQKKFNTIYPVEKIMEKPLIDKAGIPAVITGRNGNYSASNNNTQNRAFQALMQGAQKWIRIQTPNLNDDTVIRGLGGAIKRGVRVEIIASKLFNCAAANQEGQGGQNEKGFLRLMQESSAAAPQGALHDFRWFAMLKDGSPLRVVDQVVWKKPEDRKHNSHAKFMSVDDEVVAIGSANMDTQSWVHSRELNVLVFHPEVVNSWQDQVFAANFAIAQPVTSGELVGNSCPF